LCFDDGGKRRAKKGERLEKRNNGEKKNPDKKRLTPGIPKVGKKQTILLK